MTDDETGGTPCPACGRPMIHRHCKYVCPNHGVVMDCADTFYRRSRPSASGLDPEGEGRTPR